jgi:sugar lactone lactonase YvrE
MLRSVFAAAMAICLFASCDDDDNPSIQVTQERYTLPGDTLFPEGIAYNARTGTFYTGSTTSGDIYGVNVQTGNVSLFAAGASQNRKVATGMKIDGKNRLWVCGGAEGKIHVLNLANGAVLRTWDAKALYSAGFINDCISDGSYIYFTDSQVRKIYRAKVDADTVPAALEQWLTFTDAQIPFAATGTNANGIVNTPDNRYLIVVVSSSGKLYRIEKATQAITEITLNTPVNSGDGMYLDGSFLYVSRNATNQIFPVQLNAAVSQGTVGTGFGTGLLFNTTIDKAGNYFLVVNGQLNRRGTPPTPVLPFTVIRVNIP